MSDQRKRNWTRITLIVGAVLTAISIIPIAMTTAPGVTLDTTQGLIYMFSLPLAGIGLILGLVLLLIGSILALRGLLRR